MLLDEFRQERREHMNKERDVVSWYRLDIPKVARRKKRTCSSYFFQASGWKLGGGWQIACRTQETALL